MKKILLAISALSAALFSTAANADISVSGSANAVYVDAGGNSQGHTLVVQYHSQCQQQLMVV